MEGKGRSGEFWGGEFAEDHNRIRGADAIGAGEDHPGQVGQRANAAGSLDAGAVTDHAAQQGDIVDGSSADKAGRGLEVISAGSERELAGEQFFVQVEHARLKNDFY